MAQFSSEAVVLKRTAATIAEIVSIDGPGYTRDSFEGVSLGTDVAGVFAGANSIDDITLTIQYDANVTTFEDDLEDKVASTWNITYPCSDADPGTATIAMTTTYVTAHNRKIASGSTITADVTLTCAGTVTITADT